MTRQPHEALRFDTSAAAKPRGPFPGRRLAPAVAAVLLAGAGFGAAAADDEAATSAPYPLGERLHYSVRWLGMKCGAMTLESYAVPGVDDTTYVVVMTARSSKFFDGIYRVRTRIESRYSGRLESSVRYHEVSEEKKKIKDELYEFDHASDTLTRVRNGQEEKFELGADHVLDPLALVFKLRRIEGGIGDGMSLVLATTKGPLETAARIVKTDIVSTEFGKRPARIVVPEPKDGMLFSKSGKMELWIGTDPQRTLYRIEFDLSFGKLTAVLQDREPLGTTGDHLH